MKGKILAFFVSMLLLLSTFGIRLAITVGAPTAVCSVTPSTVYVGDSVTFSSAGSSDGGYPPLTYEWDVDSDGSVEYTTANVAAHPNLTAGDFNVTLTVTNALNLTDSAICYWTVLEKAGPIIDLYTSTNRWASVDTYESMTGKGPNMPTDALTPGLKITLFADVTWNGAPEMWALVTFEAIWEWQVDWYDPNQTMTLINQTIMVATNYTDTKGITSVTFTVPTASDPGDPNDYIGKWIVIAKTKVKEITVQDTMRFDVGYLIMLIDQEESGGTGPGGDFIRGFDFLTVNITVKSIHWIPRYAVFTVTVYSDANELIGFAVRNLTVPGLAYYCSPYHFNIIIEDIPIPNWANVGIGKVETSVLTALPQDNGTSYSPSISNSIVISWLPGPNIVILSPENMTYGTGSVPLTFTVDEPTSWIGYSLDNQANITITGNTTLVGLSDGAHNVIVYANDTSGDMRYSKMVYFTADTTPPSISIVSPENKTYAATDIPLTFTVDEPVTWIGYSLDGQMNVAIAGNTTLSGLSNGTHSVIVYANDTAGNMGSSEIVYFARTSTQITNVTVSLCSQPGTVIDEAYWTWIVDVNVTVHNSGTAPINITVNAYYYNATLTQQIGAPQNITNLPPSNTTTLTFSWDISGVPLGFTYTVKANATSPSGGSDEFINGNMTRILWGDINGDGDVDFFDLGKMVLVYSGFITGPPELVAFADLDGDCDVDFFDLGKMILIYSGRL